MLTFLRRMVFSCPFILILLSHPEAAAATKTVCSSGCAFTSIQAAVNAAVDGDEVVVSRGTYFENIDFSGDDSELGNVPKAITVRSLDPDDPSVVAGTIIDGSRDTTKSTVIFNSREDLRSVLKGFTITGAATSNDNLGGGVTIVDNWSSGTPEPSTPTIINCNISGNIASSGGGMLISSRSSSSSPTISNCVISNNTGGGILINGSSTTIEKCAISNNTGSGIVSSFSTATFKDCTISGNTAGDGGGIILAESGGSIINCIISQNRATREGGFGGGIRAWASDTLISRCTISGNTSADFGGGLAISRTPAPTIESCLITKNSSRYGGGIYCGYSGSASPSILNCTIVGNYSPEGAGGGLFLGAGGSLGISYPTVKNSIVWKNGPDNGIRVSSAIPNISYSDIQGGYSGEGNINLDPEFVGAGNYRLTNTSPCIDTGNNSAVIGTYDRDGLPRIMDDNDDGNPVVDMGAYEGSVFSNQSPVANAGIDQTVHVGIKVTLDGSGSTDPDGNYPLTYSWSFVSTPTGSAAVLSDPAVSGTDFVADLPGEYIVSLVVNDGFVDSDPDNLAILAVAHPDILIQKLQELITAINSLADEDFKNKNMKKALTNKVNALLELVINGDFQEALDKLTNDILAKTDGCAAAGAPDRNDWLVNCDSQSRIYPLIVEIVALLSVRV